MAKLTKSSLVKMIKEALEEASFNESSPEVDRIFSSFEEQITPLILSGEVQNIVLRSKLEKMFKNIKKARLSNSLKSRSPEDKMSSASKAAKTKAANQKRSKESDKRHADQLAAEKARWAKLSPAQRKAEQDQSWHDAMLGGGYGGVVPSRRR